MFALAISILCLVTSQNPTVTNHEADTDRIFSTFSDSIQPGCAVGVFKGGSVLFGKGYGYRDLGHSLPIDADTVFSIESASKQFTAACVQLLVKDKRLNWSDDIRRYIPELRARRERISLDELVHHTSGLMDCTLLLELEGSSMHEPVTLAEMIKALNAVPLSFPPKTRYSYTNTGFILLAEVVSRVTGKSLGVFADERIFKPLGMSRTWIVSHNLAPGDNLANGYQKNGSDFQQLINKNSIVGSRGVMTTVRDLAKWDDELFTGHVLGKDVSNALVEPAKLKNQFVTSYGRGVMIGSFRGLPAYRHDGGNDDFSAEFVRVPALRASVAVLANRGDINPTNLAGALFVTWFGDLAPSPKATVNVTVPEADRLKLEGYYVTKGDGEIWRVDATKTGLRMTSIEEGSDVIEPASLNEFRSMKRGEFNLTFITKDGKIGAATRLVGKDIQHLERLEDWRPAPNDLMRYGGNYVCEGLPIRIRITQVDKSIRAEVVGATSVIELTPVSSNRFISDSFSLEWKDRDILILSHMRAVGLRFHRAPKV